MKERGLLVSLTRMQLEALLLRLSKSPIRKLTPKDSNALQSAKYKFQIAYADAMRMKSCVTERQNNKPG
jgi:hypothetical protein